MYAFRGNEKLIGGEERLLTPIKNNLNKRSAAEIGDFSDCSIGESSRIIKRRYYNLNEREPGAPDPRFRRTVQLPSDDGDKKDKFQSERINHKRVKYSDLRTEKRRMEKRSYTQINIMENRKQRKVLKKPRDSARGSRQISQTVHSNKNSNVSGDKQSYPTRIKLIKSKSTECKLSEETTRNYNLWTNRLFRARISSVESSPRPQTTPHTASSENSSRRCEIPRSYLLCTCPPKSPKPPNKKKINLKSSRKLFNIVSADLEQRLKYIENGIQVRKSENILNYPRKMYMPVRSTQTEGNLLKPISCDCSSRRIPQMQDRAMNTDVEVTNCSIQCDEAVVTIHRQSIDLALSGSQVPIRDSYSFESITAQVSDFRDSKDPFYAENCKQNYEMLFQYNTSRTEKSMIIEPLDLPETPHTFQSELITDDLDPIVTTTRTEQRIETHHSEVIESSNPNENALAKYNPQETESSDIDNTQPKVSLTSCGGTSDTKRSSSKSIISESSVWVKGTSYSSCSYTSVPRTASYASTKISKTCWTVQKQYSWKQHLKASFSLILEDLQSGIRNGWQMFFDSLHMTLPIVVGFTIAAMTLAFIKHYDNVSDYLYYIRNGHPKKEPEIYETLVNFSKNVFTFCWKCLFCPRGQLL